LVLKLILGRCGGWALFRALNRPWRRIFDLILSLSLLCDLNRFLSFGRFLEFIPR
jgi:hypothetical protein